MSESVKKKNDDDILKPAEVAELWNIAIGTLRNWVADPDHEAPKGFTLGRSRVWRRRDVMGYINDRESSAA